MRHHNFEMARNNCRNSLSGGSSPKKKIPKWRKKIYPGFPETLPKNCLTGFPHENFYIKGEWLPRHAMPCPLLQSSIFSSTAKGESWFLSALNITCQRLGNCTQPPKAEMNTTPGTVVRKCTQKEAVLTVIRIITRDKFYRPVVLFSSSSFCPFFLVLESFLVGFLHHQSLASWVNYNSNQQSWTQWQRLKIVMQGNLPDLRPEEITF